LTDITPRGRLSPLVERHPLPVRAVGKIKGAAFRELLRFVAETRGAHALTDALARLPEPSRRPLDPSKEALGILAGSWYPATVVHDLLDAILHELPRAVRDDLAETGARAMVDRILQGVYRVLFQVIATPERYAHHAQRFWDAHHDNGRTVATLEGPGRLGQVTTGWTSHHEFLCRLQRHAAETLFERMGCRDVVAVSEQCLGRGDPNERLTLTWR
jgi:hypothetical protein